MQRLVSISFLCLAALSVEAQWLPPLSPILPPVSQPLDAYFEQYINPSVRTTFQAVWGSEQQCRACLVAYPDTNTQSMCAEAFARLAANYALVRDGRADAWYRRALSLSTSPDFRRKRLLEYAFYAVRGRRFTQADSLLGQLVAHARQRQTGPSFALDDNELMICFNLYYVIGRNDKLISLLSDELTGTVPSLSDAVRGDFEKEYRQTFLNELFVKTLLRTGRPKRDYVARIKHESPELTLLRGDWLQKNGYLADAEKLYGYLLELMLGTHTDKARFKAQYHVVVLKRLISLYDQTHQPEKIQPLMLELLKAYPDHLRIMSAMYTTAPSLQNPLNVQKSEAELTESALENEGPSVFNFVLKLYNRFPKLAGYAYDNALMLKASEEQERLMKQTESGKRSFRDNALAQLADGVRYKDIRQALRPGEAAIEFVSFPLRSDQWTDSTLYAALVLRHGDLYPKMAVLANAKQLRTITDRFPNYPEQGINRSYNPRPTGVKWGNSPVDALDGEHLYQLVWRPIADWLLGIKTIYFSPSGYLNALSFPALPIGKDSVLADRYTLHQRISTASVLRRESLYLTGKDPVVLVGKITYAGDSLTLSKRPKNKTVVSIRPPLTGLETIPPLPGTAIELASIRPYFSSVISLTGLSASEEQVKALASTSPKVLHIATHGFYFPATDTLYRGANEYYYLPIYNGYGKSLLHYSDANAPLLRSGLLLAGAQHVWSGGQPVDGVEDGILTAYDIANLRLPNTRLVVLSACKTGLGDLQGNQSVIGFQRAFKTIGAHLLLVSLWKVPDLETAEFMKLFYGQCVRNGISVQESFYLTQQKMRKKYPRQPYKWAAFTLIE